MYGPPSTTRRTQASGAVLVTCSQASRHPERAWSAASLSIAASSPAANDRAQILRGGVGRSGAGLLQTGEDRREQPLWCLLARLDLELSEHAAAAWTVEHAHRVIDDVDHEASLRIMAEDAPACRTQTHLGAQFLLSQIAPDQVDRGRRRRSAPKLRPHRARRKSSLSKYVVDRRCSGRVLAVAPCSLLSSGSWNASLRRA